MFAECCPTDTRQKGDGGTRGTTFAECRNLPNIFSIFAECRSLPSVFSIIVECKNVCRVFSSKALGKHRVCRVSESLSSVFSLALGKEMVCRVSDKIHSAKNMTLGKAFDSGSEAALISKGDQGAITLSITGNGRSTPTPTSIGRLNNLLVIYDTSQQSS